MSESPKSIKHENLLKWCAIQRDMIVSPKVAAKLLRVEENFLLEKIKCRQLKIVDVFEGKERILLSHAQSLIKCSEM
jgi:hypothetical protein